MRQLVANLVLVVCLWCYIAPATMATTQADLPACCRGNGKHHCAMASMAKLNRADPGFRSNSPECPYRLLRSAINGGSGTGWENSFSIELPTGALVSPRDVLFVVSSGSTRPSERSPPFPPL
jgi:hypothetical protein